MPSMKKKDDDWTAVETIGSAKIDSPLLIPNQGTATEPDCSGIYVEDSCRVLVDTDLETWQKCQKTKKTPNTLELAGPRRKIYFDPAKPKAAILTAGGLCPGLNDVIRSLVLALHYSYGVRNIFGIQNGFQGLIPKYGHELITLAPDFVSNIHEFGGSVLSSSRGLYSISEIVDSLERLNISVFFTIGGENVEYLCPGGQAF